MFYVGKKRETAFNMNMGYFFLFKFHSKNKESRFLRIIPNSVLRQKHTLWCYSMYKLKLPGFRFGLQCIKLLLYTLKCMWMGKHWHRCFSMFVYVMLYSTTWLFVLGPGATTWLSEWGPGGSQITHPYRWHVVSTRTSARVSHESPTSLHSQQLTLILRKLSAK